MTNYKKDRRIVLTLDAGGAGFVFSAMRGYHEIVAPIRLPSYADDLEKSLQTIIDAFKLIIDKLPGKPSAISFAFPGPADYPKGVIDNVGNLPAYAGGVALGPMLEEIFKLPVFINNDGDLFTFGEAAAGILNDINAQFYKIGSTKRYHNLIGITIGAGFGAGIIRNNDMYIGDNSHAGEIWIMRDKVLPNSFVEESVSFRAIVRNYKSFCSDSYDTDNISANDIFKIASKQLEGDTNAALKSFEKVGIAMGEALANTVTLLDGLVVIGGALADAYPFFAPAMFRTLNGKIQKYDGTEIPRLPVTFYNLQSEEETALFYDGKMRELPIPFSNKTISYDAAKRTGVGLTRLGTNKAVAIGAYEFALRKIDLY